MGAARAQFQKEFLSCLSDASAVFLCHPYEEKSINRDCFVRPSIGQ